MKKNYYLAFLVLLCFVLCGYGQCLTDNFNTGYGNWSGNGTYQDTAAGLTGNGTGYNSRDDEIITNLAVTNAQTLTFWLARSPNIDNKTFSVEYSTSNTGPWTSVRTILVSEVTTTHQEFTVNLNLAGAYYLRLAMTQRTNGSFFLDDIEVNCGVSSPEIQLSDNTATNQNCGYTLNYGAQAISSNTDLTFNITNVGSEDLDITSFGITGDYIVLSPTAIPFTLTTGNSQTVTLRFLPSGNGIRNGVLTISNTDTDEANCTLNLTGIGFTPSPEINVEGDLGSFPNISDGDITPQGTDNTLFASTAIGSSQTKSYRIQNLGTLDLIITSIETVGGDTGDFIIDPTLTFPITITPSTLIVFEIEFSPITAGIRNTAVHINNNDADENPYNFSIRGTGLCTATGVTITPNTGAIGTVATIIGTNFGGSTTATISGIAMDSFFVGTTQLDVTIPVGATTGNIIVINDLGCSSTISFTVINNQIGGCEGSTVLSDLILSEITDATIGGLSYIEIYNGTGVTVNLSSYSLSVYSNGEPAPSGTVNLNNFNLITNSTYVVAIGVASSPDYIDPNANSCPITGGNGELADQISSIGGINKKDADHDVIRLLTSGGTVTVDEFGVYQDDDWMDSTNITGDRGFNFRRRNTSAQLPDPSFTLAELGNWTSIDWVGSGLSSCGTNDYSTIGNFDYSSGSPPSVVTQPIIPSSNCDLTTSISVLGAEGIDGGNALTYQWYYSAPSDLGYTAIPNNMTYNNVTTNTLSILNTLNLEGYQYYCQIRENDDTCYTASNSVKLTILKSEWDGTNWSTPPAINRIAIINSDYDTSIGTNGETSFEACQLIVNAGTLNIANNTFVKVQNDITVDGTIVIKTDGSIVQVDDLGVVNGDVLTTRSKISIEKETAPLATYQEYTYWSSPVFEEVLTNGLNEADPNRIFWFNGRNFKDTTREFNNDNSTSLGQDDIDDNADDWQPAILTDEMIAGTGYAATHSGNGFFPQQYIYIFEGVINNGVFNVPIFRDDSELNDNNWNFIGNPYPSAIDADLFLTANTSIDQTAGATSGAIFFWSHNTPADGNTNGNEHLNYSQSDYAIINGSGQTMGGDMIMPTRNIPSGQGFFVSMTNSAASVNVGGTIERSLVLFNNSMRVNGSNNQFFRASNNFVDNKIWLNLTSNNGVFNQILVAYIEGATNGDDGMYYDAIKNGSTNANSIIYSIIEDNPNKKFVIQGKAPNSLDGEEIIPFGFITSIEEATLYTLSIHQLEGQFMNENSVFLKDNLMNTTHNLNLNNYVFTSEIGEFNNRFEIVFKAEALSEKENLLTPKEVIIMELSNGDITISVGNNTTIHTVEILDNLGRTIHKLKGQNSNETFSLSRLSQAPYIAKITLSTGQVIVKKAIKRF